MYIIFQKGVDNFEMEHKTCSFLVRRVEPRNLFKFCKYSWLVKYTCSYICFLPICLYKILCKSHVTETLVLFKMQNFKLSNISINCSIYISKELDIIFFYVILWNQWLFLSEVLGGHSPHDWLCTRVHKKRRKGYFFFLHMTSSKSLQKGHIFHC